MARFGLGRGTRITNGQSSPATKHGVGANDDGSLLNWELDDILVADIIDLNPASRPLADRGHSRRQPFTAPKAPSQPKTAIPRLQSATTYPGDFFPDFSLEFTPPAADERIDALRLALDEALEAWWSDSLFPPLPLVRDALLALEAGHEVDEGHRTLLLRATLARRKGILTALRHQSDPERTAFLIKEAALDPVSPLSPVLLWQLKEEDRGSPGWLIPLERELADELRMAQGTPHQLATAALAALNSDTLPADATFAKLRAGRGRTAPATEMAVRPAYWSPGRIIVVMLMALAITVGSGQPGRSTASGLAPIAAGDYKLVKRADEHLPRTVALPAFAIDRSEVTNANYRQCVLVGQCSPLTGDDPAANARFNDQHFDDYPVGQVTWKDATRFCAWLGKRLPTAEEWEVAASFSAPTERSYRYPWGDVFQAQRANTRESQLGGPRPVASYQPHGDSPSGLVDMAGNVAEWTATPITGNAGHVGEYIVKGGAFADDHTQAAVSSEQLLAPSTAAPWLGFRCAADLPGS